MSTYTIGHTAEERAARYLAKLGFQIRQLNWRTRYCEIDIVAQKADRIYFVEVKYRSTNHWGHGYEYVAERKLAQMRFAAGFWMARHRWSGESQLAVISVDDSTFRLEMIEV